MTAPLSWYAKAGNLSVRNRARADGAAVFRRDTGGVAVAAGNRAAGRPALRDRALSRVFRNDAACGVLVRDNGRTAVFDVREACAPLLRTDRTACRAAGRTNEPRFADEKCGSRAAERAAVDADDAADLFRAGERSAGCPPR